GRIDPRQTVAQGSRGHQQGEDPRPGREGARPRGGVEPPGVCQQVRLRPQRQGNGVRLAGQTVEQASRLFILTEIESCSERPLSVSPCSSSRRTRRKTPPRRT